MSSIQDILNVEREAEQKTAGANKQAEEIKAKGQAEAAAIRADAQAQCDEDEQQQRTALADRLAAEADTARRAATERLAARRKSFEQHAKGAVDWMIDRLLSAR